MSALCRRNQGWAFPDSKPHSLAAQRLRRANGTWHRTQFTWKGCGAQNTRSRWMAGRAELVCLAALLKISMCASLEGGRVPFLHSGSEIKPLQLGLAMWCPTPRVLWAAPAHATHDLEEPGKAGDAVVCTSSILGILQLPWKPEMLTALPGLGVSMGPVPAEVCDSQRAQGCRRDRLSLRLRGAERSFQWVFTGHCNEDKKNLGCFPATGYQCTEGWDESSPEAWQSSCGHPLNTIFPGISTVLI